MDAVADIGVIGLAVMGQNLILNMNDHGFVVCAYNRTVAKVDLFLENEAKCTKVVGAHSNEEFVAKLKKPRKVMLMVKAGSAVDDFIASLLPLLEKGDIIIDGGNAHYPDTVRRELELSSKGIFFVGCGVSGGEEGARYGPSLMPGGSKEAWPTLKPIFQSIAAKSPEGEPCCDWVGPSGSGHYVKMVHNGIEYGDMQVICEAFSLLRDVGKFSTEECGHLLREWNKTELDSYLIEITSDILLYKDSDEKPLVDKIRDTAGQKGTGKWTAISALEMGAPLTLIGEAVFARCLSALKDERVVASNILSAHADSQALPYVADVSSDAKRQEFAEKVRQAVYAAKLISYAQGFVLLREAAKEFKWSLNYGGIALMWRGGCIIRSVFLGEIKKAFDKDPNLLSLLTYPFFSDAIQRCMPSYRSTVAAAVLSGVPTPCLSTSLAFYDGYRSARLPANLLQAQRDYFGAHTYELEANPGTFHHTNWTGRGGKVFSSTYMV